MCKENRVHGIYLRKGATITDVPVYLNKGDKHPVYVKAYKHSDTESKGTVFIFKYEKRWYYFIVPYEYRFINDFGDYYVLADKNKAILTSIRGDPKLPIKNF